MRLELLIKWKKKKIRIYTYFVSLDGGFYVPFVA